MPFGFARHSNRSSQALDNNSQAQRAPSVDSPPQSATGEDNAYDLRNPQPQSYSQAHTEGQQSYIPINNLQDADFRPYQDQADVLLRSQSQRYTSAYPPPPGQPLPKGDAPISAANDPNSGDLRKSYSIGPNSGSRVQQPATERKSIGRLLGLSKSPRGEGQPTSAEQQPSLNSIGAIGRRVSKRQKDSPIETRILAQNTSAEQLHQSSDWQPGQGSDYHLPSPHEADEDTNEVDAYLIQQQDQEQAQGSGYDPRLLPPSRLNRGDQDLTVRVVDENLMHPQYQQQQQPNFTQQPQQHLAQLHTPVSPSGTQAGEYHQQSLQYQINQSLADLGSTNLTYRTLQNPEVISQLSHDSPTEASEEQRPSSMQSPGPSQASIAGYGGSAAQEHPVRTTSIQGPRPLTQTSTMPPPLPPQAPNRKSVDTKQTLQGDSRAGPPPAYSQQQFSGSNQGGAGGPAGQLQPMAGGNQPGNYRGSSLQREYGQPGTSEQGRNTPPLSDNRESEMDKILVKYKKVKGLYFEKQAQVEQLQNTLANQRLSLSRTSLDDSEYSTRFGRLDGAIKEIAFSIRKDWKIIPRWLAPYVNQDAQKVGTKEMTAVGRACISRWIFDEIFQKCFHPGLDIDLSLDLKRIEQNVRLVAPHATSQEEADALDSKIIQWKLTTIEGLSFRLNSPKCADAKSAFTQMAVSNLTAHLVSHLQSPPPQGIEGNATSIIELAVGIASHLPLESRDISITYPLPGDIVIPPMKVEQPLPPLDNPGVETSSETEGVSDPIDSKETTTESEASKDGGKTAKKQDKPKTMHSTTTSSTGANGKKPIAGGAETGDSKGAKERVDGLQKVRFAGFMGVEVRGRQWLIPAPVWTI